MVKIFTDEMIEFVKENTKGISTAELMRRVNERFNTNFTLRQIKNCKANHRLPSGVEGLGQFKPGHSSWNKGLKMSEETKEKIKATKTMFDKGHLPVQTLPLYTERKMKGGYIEIKVSGDKYRSASGRGQVVSEDTKWIPKQQKVWIDHYGDIPPKHKIIFLDKNKLNFDIDNLACVSMRMHATMCRKGRYTEFKEVTQAGKLLTELEQTIRKSRG